MALQIVAMASKSPNSPEFPNRSSTAPKNSSIRSKKRAARNSLTRPNPTKSHLPTRRRRRRRSRRSDRYLATPHNTRHRSIIQNCNRLSPISELLHSTRRRQFKHSIFSINCRKRLKTSKIALASYYLGGASAQPLNDSIVERANDHKKKPSERRAFFHRKIITSKGELLRKRVRSTRRSSYCSYHRES